MNFNRSFLIAVVAVGAMTLSACGKKKEDAKDMGAPAPAPTQPPATTPPVSAPNGQQAAPQPRVLVPPPQSQPNAGALPPPNSGTQPQVDQASPRSPRGHGRPSTDQGSAPSAGQQAPAPIDPSQQRTGARNGEGLPYTGSAQDDTLNALRRGEDQRSAPEQQQNRSLAESITQVDLSQNLMTGEAIVSVYLNEGGRSVVYNLVSPLIENVPAKIKVADSIIGVNTTGRSAVGGTMQCIDGDIAQKTCANVLISMEVKKGNKVSTAKILVRDSVADMHADFEESSGNPNFEKFKDFLLNSYLHTNTDDKVKSINMQTFEVVNGRSGFQLRVIGENHEFLCFEGELLTSDAANHSVNTAVTKELPRRRHYILGSDQWRVSLLNTIGQVRLVMNDGNGTLKLRAMTMPRANYPVDIFTMTFTRRVNPMLGLSEAALN